MALPPRVPVHSGEYGNGALPTLESLAKEVASLRDECWNTQEMVGSLTGEMSAVRGDMSAVRVDVRTALHDFAERLDVVVRDLRDERRGSTRQPDQRALRGDDSRDSFTDLDKLDPTLNGTERAVLTREQLHAREQKAIREAIVAYEAEKEKNHAFALVKGAKGAGKKSGIALLAAFAGAVGAALGHVFTKLFHW